MAINAIDMVRKIRNKLHRDTQAMTAEELTEYIRKKAVEGRKKITRSRSRRVRNT